MNMPIKVTLNTIKDWLEAAYLVTSEHNFYKVHALSDYVSFVEMNVVAKQLGLVHRITEGHVWTNLEKEPTTEMCKDMLNAYTAYMLKKSQRAKTRKLNQHNTEFQTPGIHADTAQIDPNPLPVTSISARIINDYTALPMAEKQKLMLERLDQIIYLLQS